jgi:hypothetical protein
MIELSLVKIITISIVRASHGGTIAWLVAQKHQSICNNGGITNPIGLVLRLSLQIRMRSLVVVSIYRCDGVSKKKRVVGAVK